MLLTSLIHKRIIVNNTPRGLCIGVGLAKKDGAIKYLICSETDNQNIRFSIPFSLVVFIKEDAIHLQKLRAVTPTKCAYLFTDKPVYTIRGDFLGFLHNAEWINGMLTFLTVNGKPIPYASISAISDAVLVRQEPIFPIGQRIPASYVNKTPSRENVVTKSVLRRSLAECSLIRLTLSLPPFNVR